MNLIKSFCQVLLLVVLFISCDEAPNSIYVDNFDHEGQIPIDNDSLVNYLKTHYYNTNDGAIWTKGVEAVGSLPLASQTSLYDHPDLETMTGIEVSDVEGTYTMYSLMLTEGDDANEAGTPSLMDSVYFKYKGFLLDSTAFDNNGTYPNWASVSGFVPGFSYGLTKFKGGTKFINPDRTFGHTGFGIGYVFFPSGLGYRNSAQGLVSASSPLVFKIEVHEVNLSDTDRDGIPSKYEVINNLNGTVDMIDTDGDGFNDHNDIDDDGDKILTKTEADSNLDGEVSSAELNAYLQLTYPGRFN
ncbi:FKBP-type peptidyl-prolyl cis-trans isomerase [Bacteroidota bacterium]